MPPRRIKPDPVPTQPPPPAFVPLPEDLPDEEADESPMPLAASIAKQYTAAVPTGTFPNEGRSARPPQVSPVIRFPNGSRILGTHFISATDIRLPVAGETIFVETPETLEIKHPDGDFIVLPGTPIYQRITSVGLARYSEMDSRWLFLVEVGNELVWVQPREGPDVNGSYLWELIENVGTPG